MNWYMISWIVVGVVAYLVLGYAHTYTVTKVCAKLEPRIGRNIAPDAWVSFWAWPMLYLALALGAVWEALKYTGKALKWVASLPKRAVDDANGVCNMIAP